MPIAGPPAPPRCKCSPGEKRYRAEGSVYACVVLPCPALYSSLGPVGLGQAVAAAAEQAAVQVVPGAVPAGPARAQRAEPGAEAAEPIRHPTNKNFLDVISMDPLAVDTEKRGTYLGLSSNNLRIVQTNTRFELQES